ncbi:methylase (plasmid) [Alcanivorax sp. N3-2A]|nr:methylase [Alcanivorax sp. N3-2A]ASK36959.1 methylase [Alcanivorax sp. N3-2A]|tara:strand:+ start:44385 stop:44966 length:582 start_codon:yes stop_codon:yes gene_type:complete
MTASFSQAAESNKGPIAEVLAHYLRAGDLLEFGAGTGQHAVWLAQRFPAVRWRPGEQPENLPGLQHRLDSSPADNLQAAIILRAEGHWPEQQYDYIYTANTFHIMAKPLVRRCIRQMAAHLRPDGRVFVYGPFNQAGNYTSDSNRRFDLHLKQRDLAMGLRDQEWVVAEFTGHRLGLLATHEMPANNRLLVFG